MIRIFPATYANESTLDAVNALLPQLSTSAPALDHEALQRVLESDALSLFLAELDGRVVGMLTLLVAPIPTGVRAIIEDVVTDEAARGQGVGRQLVTTAIDHARRLGAKTVDLTSRPAREAANGLYVSLGFSLRETNVYRFVIERGGPSQSV
ncbi:MAG: GNAT family N-acetyltransferase [Acidimicrobiaceae bacterium]|nr:GNAT family N-acetyltransferase [Acidimicrobiaceae bacterium]